jgi:hypothetical protein
VVRAPGLGGEWTAAANFLDFLAWGSEVEESIVVEGGRAGRGGETIDRSRAVLVLSGSARPGRMSRR